MNPDDISVVKVRGTELRCHTPTDYLREMAADFESVEPQTLDWIESFPEGEVVYDVGASHGLFSLFAAVKRNADIVAFEPEAQNFALLERNRFLNRSQLSTSFVSLCMALGAEVALDELFIHTYETGLAMKVLGTPVRRTESKTFDPANVQQVPTFPLDFCVKRLGVPQPHHMKIDVDGSESDVLKGAARVLSSRRLRSVSVEIEKEASEDMVREELVSRGFALEAREQVEDYDAVANLLFRKED